MGLLDDLAAPTPAAEMTRRRALGTITGTAFCIAGAGTLITTVRFLRPNVLFEPVTRFRIGRPEDIAVGTLIVMPEQKIYVVRSEQGFFAMSSVCTHLGCMTRHEPEKQRIFCPCHGSRFDEAGRVTGGPAPKPLERRFVGIESDYLVVDVREVVGDDFVLEA